MKRPLDEAEAFRAQELLLDRALYGLDHAEAAELATLGQDGDESFDLAAAALDVATVRLEAMPAGVADRVLAAASAALRSGGLAARVRDPGALPVMPQTLAGVVPARSINTAQSFAEPPAAVDPSMRHAEPPAPVPPQPLPVPREAPVIPIRRSRAPVIVAWMAAAACLALAVGAVLWARGKDRAPAVAVETTPAAARAALIASAGDAQALAWQATEDAAAKGASGDVVWSPSQQRGYMRFRGLLPNDPKVAQYQLWIFDKQRDERFPVDGGVFDVDASGEVIVPISPKLRVADAVLFAVTVEVPGGVVVSKRERIVVTAAPARAG